MVERLPGVPDGAFPGHAWQDHNKSCHEMEHWYDSLACFPQSQIAGKLCPQAASVKSSRFSGFRGLPNNETKVGRRST
eukprot:6469906-Amphidinium_carterae.5